MLSRVSSSEMVEWVAYFKLKNERKPADKVEAAIAAQRSHEIEEFY